MDFRSLQYFVVTAQELNITRAAEKLNMSQPPLSNQIKNLEEELGVQLFIRGKRRLQLTSAGSLLYRRAAQMLHMADQTRSELSAMSAGLTGTLFLGLVEGRAPFYAAKWISGFREEFPNVKYELWNGSSDDVLEQLKKGLADLAVIAAPYDTEHLEGITVGSEPWVALISKDHPLAQMEGNEIPLRSLVGEPLIIPRRKSRVEAIYRWFQEINASPTIFCVQSNYLDALALSGENVGISIFPQTMTEENSRVVSKVITQPTKSAEYVLVWSKEHRPSELTLEFIHYVEDFLAEESGTSSSPLTSTERL